jgi:hypothetical protein
VLVFANSAHSAVAILSHVPNLRRICGLPVNILILALILAQEYNRYTIKLNLLVCFIVNKRLVATVFLPVRGLISVSSCSLRENQAQVKSNERD